MNEPQRSARAVAGWMHEWPTWLLIACFVFLAIVFGAMGVLDDWARVLLAVVFLAVAFALAARWRDEHMAGQYLADVTVLPPEPPEPPDAA